MRIDLIRAIDDFNANNEIKISQRKVAELLFPEMTDNSAWATLPKYLDDSKPKYMELSTAQFYQLTDILKISPKDFLDGYVEYKLPKNPAPQTLSGLIYVCKLLGTDATKFRKKYLK